ncbi:MAG: hypothetical protein IM638_12920 [Bacteroidetes bacterium]|nr:hypothetical protein [Bacteroidota bacterium]
MLFAVKSAKSKNETYKNETVHPHPRTRSSWQRIYGFLQVKRKVRRVQKQHISLKKPFALLINKLQPVVITLPPAA